MWDWMTSIGGGSQGEGKGGEGERLLGRDKATAPPSSPVKSGARELAPYEEQVLFSLSWGHVRQGIMCCFGSYYPATTIISGMNMAWSAEAGYLTPTFLSMGLSLSGAGRAWMLGSVIIILLMPFLAARSDVCTHPWGRRRIFILWGVILSVVGLLLISNAQDLGYVFGDSSSSSSWGIAIGVMGVLLLQVSLDCVYMTQRALVADTVAEEDVGFANAAMTFNNGLGRVLGFGLGSLNLVGSLLLSFMVTNVRALYTLTCLVLLLSALPTLIQVQETPYKPQGQVGGGTEEEGAAPAPSPSFVSTWRSVYEGCRYHMPPPVMRVAIVQGFNYGGWALFFYYGTDWFGSWVYNGDSSEDSEGYDLYEEGVECANLGFLLLSMVNVLVSLPMELVAEKTGIRLLWGTLLGVSAVLFLAMWWVPQGGVGAGLAIFSCLGVPFAAMNELPWIIVTAHARGSERAGLISTFFRLAEVTPYVVVGLASGVLDYFEAGVRVAFVASAALIAVAAILTPYLLIEEEEEVAVGHHEEQQSGREGSPGLS